MRQWSTGKKCTRPLLHSCSPTTNQLIWRQRVALPGWHQAKRIKTSCTFLFPRMSGFHRFRIPSKTFRSTVSMAISKTLMVSCEMYLRSATTRCYCKRYIYIQHQQGTKQSFRHSLRLSPLSPRSILIWLAIHRVVVHHKCFQWATMKVLEMAVNIVE